MKNMILLGLIVLVLSAGTALATEIPLPGLIGDYVGADEERTVLIEFGAGFEEILSVSLELQGVLHTSWVSAEGDTSSWGGEFSASFLEPETGFWFCYTHWSLDGDFHTILQFDPFGEATWDFLLDGQGQLTFGFLPFALVGNIDGTGPEPTGTITSARLWIETPVAADASTFGHVKALYR